MDAVAQLALMTKAKLGFEEEGTFLSFPGLSPLTYPVDSLRFSDAETTTAADLAQRSEFSRIVNQVPRGPLAQAEESEYFWDIYKDVLETAQLASGVLTPEEKEHLGRTRAFLYERTPDGLRQDGPALKRYNQMRDAHFAATQAYKNGQITAKVSDDALVKERWTEIDEPRLREVVDRVEREWLTQGRAEIEAALQVEEAYAARNPARAWSEWRKSFIDDLDMETDTSLNETANTAFSPNDVFDMEWQRFQLTRAEIAALVEEAPQELKDIFTVDLAQSNIESLSFEYRSVKVTRPWFKSSVFKSRFWRLPPGAPLLSEGQESLNGRCPAYVAALVFARKIEAKFKDQSATTTVDPRTVFQLQATTLQPKFAMAALKLDLKRSALLAASTPAVTMHATAAPAAVATPAVSARTLVRDHRLRLATFPGVRTGIWNPGLILTRPDVVPTPDPTPPPPAVDEVTILAFICKRLPPLCPDPDPTLTWA